MPKINIEKEYSAYVDFEEFCKTEDSPYEMACENADVSYWNEYCSVIQRFKVVADSPEALDEKVMDLISHIEQLARNISLTLDYNSGEYIVKGFDYSQFEQASKNHTNILVNYGHAKFKPSSEFFTSSLPENYVVVDNDEYGDKMVIFFSTYDDVFGDMSEQDKVVYTDDYKLNTKAKEYGLEEDAYGEVLIFTKEFISKYLEIEDD